MADRRILRLTGLLDLQQRLRAAATVEELGFLLVNDTAAVAPFRQAALWLGAGRGGRIAALSGLAVVDGQAPYVAWLQDAAAHLAAAPAGGTPRRLAPADLPAPLAEAWDGWLPPHALWIPLICRDRCLGSLLLGRDEAWTEGELRLLEMVADSFAHALTALDPRHAALRPAPWRGPVMAGLLLAGITAAAALPVRESVLAPAEVIAREPDQIRAPLDGTIERIHVRPNQPVVAGQLLLSFDPARLQNQLEVARRAAEVTELELRQTVQASIADTRARAAVPVLQARLEQQRAEAGYLREMLGRIEMRAARDGIVVFDDPNDWNGRPVATGERILLVADPARVELDIRLPVADAIDLPPGAEVRFFLNVDPRAPVGGALTFIGYRAQPGPDGVLAFRLKAAFTEGAVPLRIGLKGTAKIYGGKVALGWYVLRKPLAWLRTWLGF
mgnify:CR=1 FL=1